MAESVFLAPGGLIGIEDDIPFFWGDHPAVVELTLVTGEPGVPLHPGGMWEVDWTTPGGIMLALIQADYRFRMGGEWHRYVPRKYREADIPDMPQDDYHELRVH